MSDIVLVHGTTQSAAGFAWLVAALERAGHRSISLDVPSAAATAARYADLLASQVPADLDRPVVVAHSAAGLILPALPAASTPATRCGSQPGSPTTAVRGASSRR